MKKKDINDKLIHIYRKIVKNTQPVRRRIRLYRLRETLSIALSSIHNVKRDDISEQTALEFNTYLNKLSAQEREAVIQRLKRNLDQSSQEEVDRFISRQDYIYRHNILEQKDLFTIEEYKQQDLVNQEEKKQKKEFKNYNFKHYTVETLFGHNGLKSLPQEQTQKLKQGTFLDIGALDGDSALIFHKHYQASKVYSFEPEKHNYKRLEHTANTLGNDIIVPVKKAISNRNFTTKIFRKGGASKLNNETGEEEVTVTTVDDFAKERNINKVDLIKLDIEGEEMNALKGAENTIKRDKPTLAISIYHNPQDFFEIKPYLEQLIPEYKYIIVKTNPFSLNHELMLMAYV